MGIEGETYEKNGDGYALLPQVTEAQSIDEGMKEYALYLGGGYPGHATDEWFKGVETLEQAMDGAELVAEYDPDEVWSQLTFTEEESTMISSTGQDIEKAVEENQSAFITGKRSLDEWDDYVAQFDAMGLDEYVGAQQAAYDRRNG